MQMRRFYPNLLLHKSLNQCDNVQVSIVSMNNHLIVLKLNIWIWKPTNFPAPRKHTYRTFTTVLRLQWRVSYNKLFLCAVWHITSASHPTHCKMISLSLSISRDELCPEDKLQRWISIIVSLLHSFCESGGPALKASKSSRLSLDIWSSSFQTHMLPDTNFVLEKKLTTPTADFLEAGVIWEVMSILTFFSPLCEKSKENHLHGFRGSVFDTHKMVNFHFWW